MNRCHHLIHRSLRPSRAMLAALALACTSATLAWNASAQVANDTRQRQFPDHALRGVLMVTAAPPAIRLNGKPDRLSPGARIRDTHNRIVLTGSLIGQEVLVNYTRESGGLVHEVWLLTQAEAAQQRAGNSDFVIRNYRFDSEQ